VSCAFPIYGFIWVQIEESEDIRFNYRLSSACAGDKHTFCREVRPGSGDVLSCLESHMAAPGFSGGWVAAGNRLLTGVGDCPWLTPPWSSADEGCGYHCMARALQSPASQPWSMTPS
jgi:hypothetical protein